MYQFREIVVATTQEQVITCSLNASKRTTCNYQLDLTGDYSLIYLLFNPIPLIIRNELSTKNTPSPDTRTFRYGLFIFHSPNTRIKMSALEFNILECNKY